MRQQLRFAGSVALFTLAPALAQAQEGNVNVKYSWMLPKTVLETTITYSFVGCEDTAQGANLKIKIAPTLVARAIPDTHVGRIARSPAEETQSFWEDRNITLKTFAGSHILGSIGSSPASQAGQIITNILTGLTKIVAVGLGVPPVGPAAAAPPPPAPPSKCGKAKQIADDIEKKKDDIASAQNQLAAGVDEATQKKLNGQIQALQALIAAQQSGLDEKNAIVIKRTIDPGFTLIDINATVGEPDLFSRSDLPEPHPIDASGLVATFKPTSDQLKKAGWYEDVSKVSAPEMARLDVNVYLNFEEAVLSVKKQNGKYFQTPVSEENGEIFRDVAYIPVVVWRGAKTTTPTGQPLDPTQLTQAQMMPFGQYGRTQVLPFQADTFKSLGWSMTFQENGEVTDAQFSNKAWGVGATGAFASAAGAANAIATEQRSSTSASAQASVLQGQADLIYQQQRLRLCETNPANCAKN